MTAEIGAIVAAAVLGLFLALSPLPFAIALVGAAAAVLLLLRFRWLALALMLLAAPWGALENVVLGASFVDSGQLAFLILSALWLARSVLRRRRHRPGAGRGIVIPHTPLNLPLAIFIGIASLSLLSAPSIPIGLKELLKWLELAVVMWIVVDLFLDGETIHLRPALAIILLAGLSQALIGVWQFGLRADGPDHFLIGNLRSLGLFYRAYGTFEQPNPFGGFVSWHALLGLGIVLGWAHRWWERRKERDCRRNWVTLGWLLFVLVATVTTGVALIMSWSRGAWLGFAAGLAVAIFFWPRSRRTGTLLLLGALLFALVVWQADLLPAPLAARLGGFTADIRLGDVRGVDINDANYSVLERLAHWQAAVSMARANLWLGVGFGNYEPAYDTFALINWPNALGHAHNYYLNLLAETGVLGLLAYLLVWAVIFWQTVRLLGGLSWPARGVALGLLAAWSALTVHHFLDKLYVNNLYLHLGAMLGILQLLDSRSLTEGSK